MKKQQDSEAAETVQTKEIPAVDPAAACSPCFECGMPVETGEYHPFAACLMFKGCHDSATVKSNLLAVQERSMKIGWENPAEAVEWLEEMACITTCPLCGTRTRHEINGIGMWCCRQCGADNTPDQMPNDQAHL